MHRASTDLFDKEDDAAPGLYTVPAAASAAHDAPGPVRGGWRPATRSDPY